MNRMGKRVFVLAIAMLVLVALPVLAGAVDVSTETDLKTYLTNGGTKEIIVTQDITLTDTNNYNNDRIVVAGNVTLKGTDITINAQNIEDLLTVNAGVTLTLGEGITITNAEAILYGNGGTIIVDGAKLVTTGSTHSAVFVSSGSITVNKGSIEGQNGSVTMSISGNGTKATINDGTISSSADNVIIAKNNAVVTINGGTVKGTGKNSAGKGYDAVHAKLNGTINITGGTVTSAYGAAVVTSPDGSINVTGGEMSGANGKTVYVWDGGSMKISGGTFADDSADKYVKDGLTVEKKDGKWHVVKIASADVVSDWDAPETGDKENLMLWVALMAMACMGLMVCRKTREN